MTVSEPVELTVIDGDDRSTITVERGTILRDALRNRGFSTYGTVSSQLNCGG
ncbi:ferredoxin I 5 [Natronobacterium gregoryi SP2]|uniref:Ferredoxin I 5 n=1 Tax=Natronobacterium gregoryi (strain ATCC 43098 / DSM 3393 / CCM 3738 / CIP 104747 / IAM 13177 / JCM 8860 / NBRC 102187 / NCIMB 2189 / SP2) TaxID=797304 RepID=L9XW37_NATGS|nr:hypothetical protein [Natronobacterium gregoryi]ELY64838.1 ferredoxin I 5 [Natronobacterium gregoryi SP2]